MSNATATPATLPCPRCSAPVVGYPCSPHRRCEGCFAAEVSNALAEAHREVREYAAGRSDFRPMFVRIDPYTQRIDSRSEMATGRAHDPADPALGRLDPELRAMIDRLPPIDTSPDRLGEMPGTRG